MNLIASTFLLMCLSVTNANAQRLDFDFKDPKEISAVSLTIDSMIEPIVGYAKGISGIVKFDPKNPISSSGKIAVEVSSVQFANDGYTATAQNFALQKNKHPQVFFTMKKVVSGKRTGQNAYQGIVDAEFTCRGIAAPIRVPVTVNYYPGRAEERTNGKYKGDLLVIRTHFSVSRSKYGISEGIPAAMVGDAVEVRVAVVGIHYWPVSKPKAAVLVAASKKP